MSHASLFLAKHKHHPSLLQLSDLHLQAFVLDSLQRNFPSAIAHYQQYKALNDSIFNEKKSNQLIAFEVQYDTQKKEQDIKLKEKNIALLTQQTQTQQVSIRQRKTERNALIVGAALLLAMLLLSYNRYRLKQLNNRQLLIQQQALQTQQQQISQKNTDLQRLLTEKEWMIRKSTTG